MRVLIPHATIQETLQELARTLRHDYQGTTPLVLCTLKGACLFLADLIRVLALPVEIGFLRVASYGSGTVSSGHPTLVQELHEDIRGRDVLVLEDIIDSGRTAQFVRQHLLAHVPASLRLCTLLNKPSRREVSVVIDYCGFNIPDLFVVGYGMDWNERYRHLPDICVLEDSDLAGASQ